MLSKSKRILFGMLHVVMLLVMVHWFLISVTYLREISWLAILGAGLLFLLAWLKRDGLKSAFAWSVSYTHLDVYKRQALCNKGSIYPI